MMNVPLPTYSALYSLSFTDVPADVLAGLSAWVVVANVMLLRSEKIEESLQCTLRAALCGVGISE